MQEDLISSETAKLAKEKGFDFATERMYHKKQISLTAYWMSQNGIYYEDLNPAPTQSLLQKWLREKHKIHISIELTINGFGIDIFSETKGRCTIKDYYKTYEKALEEGLQRALKIITI